MYTAVETVGPMLRNLIDNSSAGTAELSTGVVEQRSDAREEVGHDGLNGFAAKSNVVHVLSVHHEVVGAWSRAVDRQLDETIASGAPKVLYGGVLAGNARHLACEI